MRINREESIWVDEFTLNDELDGAIAIGPLEGSLSLVNELDGSNQIYFGIGTKQIGFIDKDDLVKLAEKIIELWKKPVLSGGSSAKKVQGKP